MKIIKLTTLVSAILLGGYLQTESVSAEAASAATDGSVPLTINTPDPNANMNADPNQSIRKALKSEKDDSSTANIISEFKSEGSEKKVEGDSSESKPEPATAPQAQ